MLIGSMLDFSLSTIGVFPIQATSNIGIAFVFGAIIGTAQWLFLRQYVPNAALWITACAIGWGLMALITGTVIEGFLEKLLFGLIPAVVTGIALVNLLPHRPLEASELRETASYTHY